MSANRFAVTGHPLISLGPLPQAVDAFIHKADGTTGDINLILGSCQIKIMMNDVTVNYGNRKKHLMDFETDPDGLREAARRQAAARHAQLVRDQFFPAPQAAQEQPPRSIARAARKKPSSRGVLKKPSKK